MLVTLGNCKWCRRSYAHKLCTEGQDGQTDATKYSGAHVYMLVNMFIKFYHFSNYMFRYTLYAPHPQSDSGDVKIKPSSIQYEGNIKGFLDFQIPEGNISGLIPSQPYLTHVDIWSILPNQCQSEKIMQTYPHKSSFTTSTI